MNALFARAPGRSSDAAWPVAAGFDFSPWRTARVRTWRRRSRMGAVVAVLAGLAGAALLQSLTLRQQRLDEARYQEREQRLAALAPGVDEARRLERRIAVEEAARARRAALEPRRRWMMALLEALEDVAQDGIALTTLEFVADERGHARARLAGLADDADGVARWTRRLGAHGRVDSVALDELRLLDATAPMTRASSGIAPAAAPAVLQRFRVTVRLAAPGRSA